MKILVIDDAAEVIEAVTVSFTLQWQDTAVLGATSGDAGLDLVEQERPDVVLLDITMPGMDGYETLKQIRLFSDVPVIMLTARDSVVDKVKGLELGADDYVTKPFDHLELLARVRAVLRRHNAPQPATQGAVLRAGDLEIDPVAQTVALRGEPVSLTRVEYKLLYHLVRNAGQILPHEMLLSKVWGREYTEEVDYLRVYIRRLRLKIEPDPEHPRFIITERGIGYRFQAAAETATPASGDRP